MAQRVAHLDMDAFYASVELLRYPELKGRPVVIGGRSSSAPTQVDGLRQYTRLRHYTGRGVVTTSTYEARALGVFSAMGLMKAAALAPDAILLPTDFEAYRYYSQLFKAAVASIAPHIEDRGIDEIYIDLTDLDADSPTLARRLQDAVRDATGLSCSIGVAPNKLLAKICSDLEKPGGQTIISYEDVPARIWPLAARKVNGIGPKASERLDAMGLHTIGDIAQADPAVLQSRFGRSYAAWLIEASHGRDDREVANRSDPKSISRETTFERDLHVKQDRAQLSKIFTDLCTRLAEDLKRKGYVGRTVGIKIRFADFRIVTRDITLPDATGDATVIRRAAGECLRRAPLAHRLRLLGVRVSGLSPAQASFQPEGVVQGSLFI